MKRPWKDLLLASSAVNLLFFRRWDSILPGYPDYLLADARPAVTYVSLMILIVFLSLAAVGAMTLVRRSGNKTLLTIARASFVLLLGLGLYNALYLGWLYLLQPLGDLWIRVLLALIVFGVAAWLLWRHTGWQRHIVPVAVALALLLAPLTPIMFAQGLYHTATTQAAEQRFEAELGGHDPEAGTGGRVVLILFDEFDQRLAFEERPDGVHLPEFDRLRAESLYATKAHAPNAFTLQSIPAMTTGRTVDLAYPRAVSDLAVDFADENGTIGWLETQTVFDRLHEQGHSIGVVGTFHPYCRLFASSLTECTFAPHYPPPAPGFFPSTLEHLEDLKDLITNFEIQQNIRTIAGINEAVSQRQQAHEIAKHKTLQPAAVETAARDGLDLAFIHLNVPHPAGEYEHGRGYWDVENERFSTDAGSSYFDSLALADRTLGEIRVAMERSGVWNETTVIVTSDHGYRATWWHEHSSTAEYGDLLQQPTDHRVVFLAKPAGEAPQALQYDEPFNLIVLGDLLEAALGPDLDSSEALVDWLDDHRREPPEHYAIR